MSEMPPRDGPHALVTNCYYSKIATPAAGTRSAWFPPIQWAGRVRPTSTWSHCMRLRRLTLPLLALPFLALSACSEDEKPAAAAEVQARTDAILRSAITNAFNSLRSLADVAAFSSFGNALSALDG